MANNNSIIQTLTLDKLENYNFRIPLYQRPYAWKEEHIIQLLEDLKTFHKKDSEKNYYLGNIVVSKIKENYFDVIDGQQRLTTLFLMLKMIEKDYFGLNYEIREEDNNFLNHFNIENPIETFKEHIQAISKWRNENKDLNLENLLNKIEIAFTQIPKEVDVVKYFEVMNNRGKQLEKHQILKAKFLETLKDDKEFDYAKIWDYCSEMNTPIEDLIYYNDFTKDDRQKNDGEGVFKKLRQNLLSFKFKDIKSKNIEIFSNSDDNKDKIRILDIIKSPNKSNDNYKEEYYSKKEYKSIVKFPIFLIQVLKIFISKRNLEEDFKSLDKIIANDRYLLDYFFGVKEHPDFLFKEASLAKDFILFLFKMRILFDYFIFKRDEKDEALFIGRDNKELLMIELLFNASAPQYFTQDWISVALSWLYENQEKILQENFINDFKDFLESFDNDLAKVRLSDTKIIDFVNEKIKDLNHTQKELNIEQLENILNRGTSTPHYWFYKLDYLLWKDFTNFENDFKKFKVDKNDFKLSRLNSIEHIHPQSKADEFEKDGECEIDFFGNLALISNHMNSKLIDQSFENKKSDIEKQVKNKTIESLKMLLVYSKYDEWNKENCKEHHKAMLKILKDSIN